MQIFIAIEYKFWCKIHIWMSVPLMIIWCCMTFWCASRENVSRLKMWFEREGVSVLTDLRDNRPHLGLAQSADTVHQYLIEIFGIQSVNDHSAWWKQNIIVPYILTLHVKPVWCLYNFLSVNQITLRLTHAIIYHREGLFVNLFYFDQIRTAMKAMMS